MRFEKQMKKGNCLFTPVATTTQPKWFSAQSSPSIISVSAEQWRTCATSWLAESLVVQKVLGNLFAQNNSETMVTPTELSTTNKTPRTNDNVQGNLLHVYKQKIAKSSRSSSICQTVLQCGYREDRGERSVFHDPSTDAELDKLGGPCREFSVPRDNAASKAKGWIRGEHEDRSIFGGGIPSPFKAVTESRS